jgi:hypothetical protein
MDAADDDDAFFDELAAAVAGDPTPDTVERWAADPRVRCRRSSPAVTGVAP